MNDQWIQFIGWIPAIIFPGACMLQLIKLLVVKKSEGVSAIAWVAFGIANLCLYVYTEKYDSYQTILGMLGQAFIDFSIAAVAVYYREQKTLEGAEV